VRKFASELPAQELHASPTHTDCCGAFALYLLLSLAAGIYLAEAAIHVRKAVTQRSEYASMVGAYSRSGVEDAAIHAPDGVQLKG
jgi:hypothetical protein